MSVFYNITKNNKNSEPIDLITSDTSFNELLDNQSNYEVGVKRFKIPTSEVDFYRIYPRRAYIGTRWDNSGRASTTNLQINDLYNLANTFQKDYDTIENERYMIVKSHKHFTQILTRTFWKTIYDYMDLNSVVANISYANEATRGLSNIGKLFQGNTTAITPSSSYIYTTHSPNIVFSNTENPFLAGKTTYSRRTLSWDFKLVSLALVSGDDVLIRDLDFFIQLTVLTGTLTGTTPDTKVVRFTLFNNLCGDEPVSSFNSIFPNGLMVSSYGSLKQTPRSDYNKDFTPNLFINDDSDIETILGSYGEYSKIEYGVETKRDYTNSPVITVAMESYIYHSNEATWVEGLNTADTAALKNAPLPMFDTIGNGNNQLQLHTYHSYMSKGLKIWANQGLLNMIGFDSSEYSPAFNTIEYTSSNIFIGSATEQFGIAAGTGYTATTIYTTSMTSSGGSGLTPIRNPTIRVDSVNGTGGLTTISIVDGGEGLTKGMLFRLIGGNNGGIFRVDRINPLGEVNLKGAILEYDFSIIQNGGVVQDDREISIVEPELSVYKRNFLYGLAITGNSFSISGEYEGEGKSTRKILSDFESDPSSNFRDYYIYQPSGDSVRYYQMNTTMPLRDVFVSVFYRDMNGNYQLLKLGSGYIASIKLHFRLKQY